jgi:hypothetical protein
MEADQESVIAGLRRSIRLASPHLRKSAGAKGQEAWSPIQHRPRVAGLEAEATSHCANEQDF